MIPIPRSTVTGKEYNDFDVVFIGNPVQAYAYLNHRAVLYDVVLGSDKKLFFVFTKADTQPLYELWKKHELE